MGLFGAGWDHDQEQKEGLIEHQVLGEEWVADADQKADLAMPKTDHFRSTGKKKAPVGA
ncbi:hypothetical protein [Salinicola peritrichatus]|uniref:hypothetical protein n=1 Tax=Salinicola peritrichatus TaxID=1267424 RepID=UPI0013A61642|nr:hypothetical protein [Salinicola peritrichatus]